MPVVDLKTKIDPNIQIRNYLNEFFRASRTDLEEANLRQRLNIALNDAPELKDYRLFGMDVSLGLGDEWKSMDVLLGSDNVVSPNVADLDVALSAKLAESSVALYLIVMFKESGGTTFYMKPSPDGSDPFAELQIGIEAQGSNPRIRDNGLIQLYELSEGKLSFYRGGESVEPVKSFAFAGRTFDFSGPGSVQDLKFSLSLTQLETPPSDFTGLDFVHPMVGLGVETFRIYPSKRVPALGFRESQSGDASISAIEAGREFETSGKLAISFFELRGEKDPYTGCAKTVFVFRCWGSPESDARALWALLDQALHNKFNEYWGDLFVYSSLRREMPELSLGDELRHLDAFNFFSAYDIVYWEYADGE